MATYQDLLFGYRSAKYLLNSEVLHWLAADLISGYRFFSAALFMRILVKASSVGSYSLTIRCNLAGIYGLVVIQHKCLLVLFSPAGKW
jgi:hypothetical protein